MFPGSRLPSDPGHANSLSVVLHLPQERVSASPTRTRAAPQRQTQPRRRAGFPTTSSCEPTDRTTTVPAPTMAHAPISMPATKVAFAPIEAP